jgi:hypothetical protein
MMAHGTPGPAATDEGAAWPREAARHHESVTKEFPRMKRLLRQVDGLLRGDFTRPEDLRAGRINIALGTLTLAGLVLGAFYGAFMGLFSVLRAEGDGGLQLIATAIKVPLLFLLTLLVTFPSLYVFSALAGSKLWFPHTLRLLLAAITVSLTVLASLGPVVGFFTLSTDSYDFMVVLNVLMFAVSGFVGVAFLRRALDRLFARHPARERWGAAPVTADVAPESPSDVPDTGGSAVAEPTSNETPAQQGRRDEIPTAEVNASRTIFRAWIVVYSVVGAQMAWILRPFIGAPDQPFVLFRHRASNFFEAFFQTLGRLFFG